MKKLRLLLFADCDRNCAGCCNKDWDLVSLPPCTNYAQFDEIMLTGGEPMIAPQLVHSAIKRIRKHTTAKIYLYTAKTNAPNELVHVARRLDGLTVTLHTIEDFMSFIEFSSVLRNCYFMSYTRMSLRLNVFEGIAGDKELLARFPEWKIKNNMTWIKNCPLPTDEVFMRYV